MPNRFAIVTGSSHPLFARAVARELNVPLAKMEITRFASHEIYVRLHETVRGSNVYIVQTATQNVNEDFMELFLMCDMAKRSFANRVHVIMPYFGYARQDRVALPRETISAKLMADLLVTAGADHVMTVDLHSDQIQGFFNIPVDNIDPSKLFLHWISKNVDLKKSVIVSVDVGGAKAAKRFADMLGLPIAVLNKQRKAPNQSEVTHIIGEVQGKRCIIYDDIVDTAGSVCNAKAALMKAGAHHEVYLAVTHPVLSGDSVKKLDQAGFKKIIVTDSVPLPEKPPKHIHVLSLAPMIGEIIQHIEEGKSVSELYL